MIAISVDERTYAKVRAAAQVRRMTPTELVQHAIDSYLDPQPRPRQDKWEQVEIYAEYRGRRVEALFLPATKRVKVQTEPLPGRSFKTPSGAARAVIAALNTDRTQPQGNGWRFWRISETEERLDVLR